MAGVDTDSGASSRYVGTATWDDVPHLSHEQKAELLAGIPPYQRDARSKGVPQLGSGAIYPILEEEITIKPFAVPAMWPRIYGLDVGWNNTAAVWGAWDREGDIVYLYSEYRQGGVEPAVHASAIKGRGVWIPGVIDPASRGRSQVDGKQLITEYQKQGLRLEMADNGVEAGIFNVYERMTTGRLKVFSTLGVWFEEYRVYRRNAKGGIVKENDHLMDCTRYLCMSVASVAINEATFRHSALMASGAAAGAGYNHAADARMGY